MITWPSLSLPALNLWNYPNWVQTYPKEVQTYQKQERRETVTTIHGLKITFTYKDNK
jgi:hypothetical protein